MHRYTLDFEKPIHELEKQLEGLRQKASEQKIDLGAEIKVMEDKIEATKREIYTHLTAWQHVQISRHPKRPYFLDYVDLIFENFVELHGDRRFADDPALMGGFAVLKNGAPSRAASTGSLLRQGYGGQAGQADAKGKSRKVMLLGHQKGRNTKENIHRNFGMAHPEGYRKALRLMQMADKFGLPIIAFIDTPGAYPGIHAEERHVAEAIAVNLREMSLLEVPIIAVVIGEGGSGGALGIGVADKVLILENAYYSVISPEGCAAILWKKREHAPEAAEALKMSAHHLKGYKLVDEVVPEPLGGAQYDPAATAQNLKPVLLKYLSQLEKLSHADLLAKRYERYRKIGMFKED